MSLVYLNNRSIAIINAWLEETQSAISQAQQHPASNTSNLSLLPTPCPSSTRQKILDSPKRNADHDAEDPSTPKRRQILTHSDNTPHASSTNMHHASSIDQGISDPSDRPAPRSSSSFPQISKSISSSRSSPVKGFRFLLMTENPVLRSNEVSEIPSMGRDLYTKLEGIRSTLGFMPSALKACVVIECV